MVLNHNSIVRKNEQTRRWIVRESRRGETEIGTSLMLMLGITVSIGCEGEHSVCQVYIGMDERTDEQMSKMDRCTGIGDEDQGFGVSLDGCEGSST